MLKKFKRYLALIPLLMVMLLNCVCYGQVFATEDSTVDYSGEFIDISQTYPEILDVCDFSSIHGLNDFYNISIPENYLFIGRVQKSIYNSFLSGVYSSFNIMFYIIELDIDNLQSNDFAYYDFLGCSTVIYYFNFNPSKNSFTFNSKSNTSRYDFIYYPDSFNLVVENSITSEPSEILSGDYFCFAFDSNVIEVGESPLDVSVSFSPELHGAFTRTRTDRGQTVTLDNFSFIVSNNSKFPVQYLMAIYRDDEFFRPFNDDALSAQAATKFNGKTYTGNPTYVYVKDEWIYLPHGTQGVITANAPSSWHYLQSGEAESVTVAFNQVKLDINVNYTCVVYAIRNDSNYATVFTNYNTFQYPACSDYCVDVSGLSCVYTSQFNILNPAEFNPNNNDNSYAFDVDDSLLFNRANGYIDENGEVIVDRVDTNSLANAGKDPNDPWSGYNPDHNAWEVYYKNQNTVSSDIDQLSNNFSSFFKFVNKVFSYFPSNYQNVIILGLTAVVVLGVLKVVF